MKNDHILIPPDNTKIWRFMDFTKYVSLLVKNASFFCRSDLLGDPFEGHVSQHTLEFLQQWDIVDGFQGTWMAEEAARKSKEYPQFHYLNCWHINEHELQQCGNYIQKQKSQLQFNQEYGD